MKYSNCPSIYDHDRRRRRRCAFGRYDRSKINRDPVLNVSWSGEGGW